jgi:16S rRNA processing protein RimM
MAVVGRIARSHGNRGQVIVNPETDFPDARFAAGSVLYVRGGDRPREIRVTSARFHRGRPIIAMEGIGTIDAAEALAGEELRVPEAALEALPDGSFYRHELVGCDVETTSGTRIGKVSGVAGEAGVSWLVVDKAGEEILIPLAAGICVRIRPGERRIIVDPPEGLLDLNR